jgi:two-component system chemotaxis response regulator CheY
MSHTTHFLVVDNLFGTRRVLRNLLQDLGYTNVKEAENGMAALAQLRQAKADLMLTGWDMPNMSGIQLLQAIRADAELKDLPVLMVTAEARKENIVAAARAGANGYMVKPFTAETLGEKLARIFSASELVK